MGKVKTAVIGVGSMGRHHARVYQEMDRAELVGVADVDGDQAKKIANRYGIKAYTDYRDLLDKGQPKAVSIAVPTTNHLQVARDAMESGADVLIEKPIASDCDEALKIINLSDKLDRRVMVGHIVRFEPVIQALKDHLNNGELGDIFQIICRRTGPFPQRIRDVGVVVDLAPHDLDLLRFLSGDEPERLYAETQQEVHTVYEDLVNALLHFKGGITGVLEINWLSPVKTRDVLVLGERGMFRADSLTQDLYFHENAEVNGEMWNTLRNLKGVSEGKMTRYSIKRVEPLKSELRGFLEAVMEDQPVPVTGNDGLMALRLALALVRSGKEKQVIEV
ncbi:MAG: Gfo/Idh/MocA family oxidoreductase [Bacteroidales bacterium]|nr:Gfo/Idh/MocA family oxidoreductase [Bacteroidales bacterium]